MAVALGLNTTQTEPQLLRREAGRGFLEDMSFWKTAA